MFRYWLVLFSFLLLVFLRVYQIPDTPLQDYDSVKNFLIIEEIKNGNFTNFFHHNSPFFYLFYTIIGFFYHSPLFFIIANSILNVILIGFFSYYFLKLTEKYHFYHFLLLWFFIGTSFFEVHISRQFSLEVLANIFCFLTFYFHYLSFKKENHLQKVFIFFGFFYVVSYKAILFLPIFLVIELLFRKTKFNFLLIFYAALPIFLMIFLGLILGLDWKVYPAKIIGSFLHTQGGRGNLGSQFSFDIEFYPLFLLSFENILIFVVIIYLILKKIRKISEVFTHFTLLHYFFLIVMMYFLGMSILLKAPRGLATIYPLIYFCVFLILLEIITYQKYYYLMAILFIFFSIGFQIIRLNAILFAKKTSNYENIALYLKEKNIKQVASAVSLQIIPMAQKYNIKVIPLLEEKDLQKYPEIEYVLLDDFRHITHKKDFEIWKKYKLVQKWHETTLGNPLIWLEHAEYTRQTWKEIIQYREKNVSFVVELRKINK